VELSGDAGPEVLAAQPHVIEGVKRLGVPLPSLLKRPVPEGPQVIEAEEPWIMPCGILKDLKVVPERGLVIQYLDDSVYLLDLDRRESTVLFQAARGLSGVWVHDGQRGQIVIFAKGEGRCFVFHTFSQGGA
jgi:hypothetical protein